MRLFYLFALLTLLGAAASSTRPAVAAGQQQAPLIRYVATDGSDAWSGTLPAPNKQHSDGPFATLEKARDSLRAVPANGGWRTIEIRGGSYALATSLVLTAADNGVTVRPYREEAVRLRGGREVKGWTPVTDAAILDRLDPAVRTHVVQTDLRAQGITDYGHLSARGFGRPDSPAPLELFWNDKPMTIARWPNVGASDGEWAQIAATPKGQNGDGFVYAGDRPSRWVNDPDVWLHGYWIFDWADTFAKVASIDPATHTLTIAPPQGVFGYTPGKRWYALNILEELDSPGEYFVDDKSGILYFYPPAAATRSASPAVVSLNDAPLIRIDGASQVTLANLTIEDSRGTGISLHNPSHVSIDTCVVRNMGNSGIDVNGGDHCLINDCSLYALGDRGVSLTGGDRQTLTPCGHAAVNCDIHDISRWDKTYRAGVNVDGVGIRVAHCHIHEAPHNAILLSGNDNIIEFNEIDRVCRETGDAGAFYMGRDWTMRGNIVRNNWFHDLAGVQGQHGFTDVMAVYLDDAASGTLVQGNVFERIHGRAIMVGGGRDDKVRDNLFVDCDIAVHVDARAQGWAKKNAAPGGEWQMQEKLASVHYDQPPYSTHYPELAAMKNDDMTFPRGSEVVGNVIAEKPPLDARWLVLQDDLNDQKIDIKRNSVVGLDAVTIPTSGPPRLNPGAAPVAPDFPRVPGQKMGIALGLDAGPDAWHTSPAAVHIPEPLLYSSFDRTCAIVVTFKADGSLGVKLKISSGFPALDEECLDSCRKMKFTPARVDGKPVDDKVEFAFHVVNKG